MRLPFDPADIDSFKAGVGRIAGFPAGEELPIRAMVFESDALDRLAELLKLAGATPDAEVLVVMDRTVMQRRGAELKPLVLALLRENGWRAEPVWLEPAGTEQVHTDFEQIARVQARLRPGIAVLAVGSGTVTDIAKHACYCFAGDGHAALPFVVFQTANSVSAYTSNMAPVFISGVKRTLPSRYPDVLICDLETLCDAPAAMTAAGVGDLLAAFSSYADWFLAQQLGIDGSYSELPQLLLGPLDRILLDNADAIRRRTPEGMAVLAKLITLAGLGMSLTHATAPFSGFEHLISHLLDLLAERTQQPLAQHGTQVALATVLSTAAYRMFLGPAGPGRVDPRRCYPSDDAMERHIHEAFAPIDRSGQAAAECWSDYREKLELWRNRSAELAAMLAHWPTVREQLAQRVRSPELVVDILRATGAPVGWDQRAPPVSVDDVRFAFLNAPLLRRRLTLADLFVFLDWDRETVWNYAWAASRALARDPNA